MHPRRLRRFAPTLVLLLLGRPGPATAEPTPSPAPAGVPVEGEAAAGPLWPLTLSTRYLASGFMEFREGRFHAGIDLKTMGRSGFPVCAAEDGEVELLRAAPEGYGRSVLLRGRSGRRYLYAHLERFADRLRVMVTAAQRRAGRYRVEVEPAPGGLPVKRGEVLALSGQSGTLGPHLHLEVRNGGGDALDPLRHGFAVRDTIAPRVLRVTVLPAAPSARVEGGLTARGVADTAGLPARLPTLRVSGPVAFAAELEERADRMHHRLAPSLVRVRCDGAEVFVARNDSFPLARQAERRLEWLETGGRREQWLWRRPQDDLPGRVGGDWSLAGDGLPAGPHEVTLEVGDAAGNLATVAWRLEVGDTAPAAAPAAGTPDRGEDPPAWGVDAVEVRLPGPAGGAAWSITPFLLVTAGLAGEASAQPLWPAGGRREGALPDPPPGWRRQWFGPEQGSDLLAPAVLFVAPDSLTAAEARRARTQQGLVALGPAAWLLSGDWPAAGRPLVDWPGVVAAAAGEPDVAAYAQGDDGAWRFAGRLQPAASGAAGAWALPLPDPGRYAVLRDGERPEIGGGPAGGVVRRRAVHRRDGVTLPRWDVFAVSLADAGAGVDAGALTAKLDGRLLVVEPDLTHGRALVELPDDLGAGPHELLLRVTDRAGLVARRRLPLRLVTGP